MTSVPLGMVCPCPSCFSGPSRLHPICSPGSNLQCAEMAVYLSVLFVISAAESRGPFRHCLSSGPDVTATRPSLFIIMANPFGVTHAFATSPTCPSSSWGFGHLQELPSKAVNDTEFQEPCLSLPIPALNYTLLLPLLCFCLLVSF